MVISYFVATANQAVDQFCRNASASIYLGSDLFREADLLSFGVKEDEKVVIIVIR